MVRPKRSLGQHFLTAPAIAEAIAREAAESSAPVALEIGPGTGSLTRALLAQPFQRIVALEADEELVHRLSRSLQDPRLTILWQDVRTTPLASLAAGKPYTIAANIPYYLTGTLLRKLFQERPLPLRTVLMVQREVAERIVAPRLSLPALWVRLHGEPHLLRVVPPGCFFPKPKVDSAILTIRSIHPNPVAPLVMEVAKRAFAQPRKQLFSSLRRYYAASQLQEALEAARIDPHLRPEAVSVKQWSTLAAYLHPQQVQ